MLKLRFFVILPVALLALFLQSCGEDESDSSNVAITQIAEEPTVINSNFTIDPTPLDSDSGDEIDVTGPWFALRFYGTNGASRKLTIASFTIEISDSSSGQTSTWTPDLGTDLILMQAEAGADFELLKTVFVGSLPESTNNHYNVTMTFEGWFNGEDDPDTDIDESTLPEDSFKKVLSFNTQ